MFDSGFTPYLIACENVADIMAEHPEYDFQVVCDSFGIYNPTPSEIAYIKMRIAERGVNI